ncbi:MAG TPA: VWA domain-containing protein [Gemmataceae bacterium]
MEQTPFGPDAKEFEINPEPRCACVLLLDVSGSMGEIISNAGEDLGYTIQSDGQTYRAVSDGVAKIDELNAGLVAYKEALAADSLAAKRVEVAIVTFGGVVQTICDFTTIDGFHPPVLTPNGDTPMGQAIREGVEMLRRRKDAYRANGIMYYRPWIFLITDGGATDEWKSAADLVKQGEDSNGFLFFAVGVEGANFDRLKQISSKRPPLRLKGTRFRDMFQWLAGTQRSASRSKPGDTITPPDPTAPGSWGTIPV